MKKQTTFLYSIGASLLIVTLTLAGCGAFQSSREETEQKSPPTETAQEKKQDLSQEEIMLEKSLGGQEDISKGIITEDIKDVITFKKVVTEKNIDCARLGFLPGTCNYARGTYVGVYGDDVNSIEDRTGLYVYIFEYSEKVSLQNFADSLKKLYGNPGVQKNNNGTTYLQFIEGTPEIRAQEPGGADEGIAWKA